MKLLAPLVRRSESRYSLNDYASQMQQLFGWGSFGFQGSQYPLGLQMSQTGARAESIGDNYEAYVNQAFRSNAIVGTLELCRIQVFSQARFQFRRTVGGVDSPLFGTPSLAPLEQHTARMLTQALLDADMAGNAYATIVGGQVVFLRPDWVDTILEPVGSERGELGYRTLGYVFWQDGTRGGGSRPASFNANEVAHFAYDLDPLHPWRGMSWLTPTVREILGDGAYTRHKVAFLENAATPNLAVTLKESVTAEQFEAFVDKMDAAHQGPAKAGKTLYLGGGADVTVVGADMAQLDFKAVQGAGETRIAAASGVGAVIAQFSEGMQGSSLNAGNYGASRRRYADMTMRHLWMTVCDAFGTIVAAPTGAHLWYDDRNISFLQEDAKDAAEIDQVKANTIRQLVDGGFEPDSAVATVWPDSQLVHTGKLSVQLQEPGEVEPAAEPMALEEAPVP